ncbi:MAG: hypothetical protein JWO62_1141 [Acidimicrobiaceae bacterium]|nr:hypothetical protein [Acidimicrobiaceae bacterium]
MPPPCRLSTWSRDTATNAVPEIDVEKLRRFAKRRVPEEFADEVRLEVSVRAKRVAIHELRPVWRGAPGEWTSMPIAQVRYDGGGLWTLYFGDRYGKWTLYFDLDAKQPIDPIIKELDTDPTSVFWG